MAASLMPSYGYVRSEWNPTDGASRFWEKKAQAEGVLSQTNEIQIQKTGQPKGSNSRSRGKRKAKLDIWQGFRFYLRLSGGGPSPTKE